MPSSSAAVTSPSRMPSAAAAVTPPTSRPRPRRMPSSPGSSRQPSRLPSGPDEVKRSRDSLASTAPGDLPSPPVVTPKRENKIEEITARLGDDREPALNRLPKLPFEVFMLLGVGLLLLGAYAFVTRSSAQDARSAESELSATLETERAAAAASTEALDLANSELTTQIEQLEQDNAALAAAVEAAGDEPETVIQEVEVGGEALDALAAQIEALEDDKAELEDRVLTAELAVSDLNIELGLDDPDFTQWIGESLTAEGAQINALDARCLGRTVSEDIGLAAIGGGLSAAEGTGANDAVVASTRAAADSCGIDAANVIGR